MTTPEIWLYGSVARGTARTGSDLDVLVVTDDAEPPMGHVRDLTGSLPQAEHLSVRSYPWVAVRQMADYGSLFLLHLKLEGRPLTPAGTSRLQPLLTELPPYQRTEADLEGFRIALADARESILDGGSVAFELSVIATVIRHCSILACYLLGTPRFDRVESISTAFHAVGLDQELNGALLLHRYRLAEARGIGPVADADPATAVEWEAVARRFVDRVSSRSLPAPLLRRTR